MVAIKRGPLSKSELMELWASVTDREYNKPLLEKEGSNIEIIEQAAEQLARVSEQIDNNTQGMFILPWSGQTAPPASGAAYARTTLQLTRNGLFDVPLLFNAGDLIIQHRLNDYSKDGPVDVTTNRLYAVENSVALGVGEAGPIGLNVVAVTVGPGFNEPTPGTLRTILQPGVGFLNSGATVENGSGATNRVIATTFPDVPITGHVGQYLLFTGGANQGRIARINGVENPDPTVPHGGVFNVAAECILEVSGVTGSFTLGERVDGIEAVGFFVSLANNRMVLVRSFGSFTTGTITGEFGGSATIVAKEQDENLIPETGSASWVVLHWNTDLHVSVTNTEQPTGGKCGYLDELGNERGIQRLSGEGDDEYRRRIAVPADVVSPGAVIRAGNGVVEPYGGEVCLREVGQPLFPGMFFDGAPNQTPFAFDLDLVEMQMFGGNQLGADFAFFDDCQAGFFDNPFPQDDLNFFSPDSQDSILGTGTAVPSFIPGETVSSTDSNGLVTTGTAIFDHIPNTTQRIFRGVARVNGPGFEAGRVLRGHTSRFEQVMAQVGPGVLPNERFYLMLNLREFRGFFIVGVPRFSLEDFGIFFDAGPNNAFDTNTVDNFFDGEALQSDSMYSRIYDSINQVRPAGVPFDIYIEDIGCS